MGCRKQTLFRICEDTNMSWAAALQIGQGVVGFMEERRAAREQQAAYERNRQAAAQARDAKIQSLNQRLFQEAEAAQQQKELLGIEALEKRERAKVAAGEAGVAGQGVDNIINNYEAQKLRGLTTINTNIDNLERQIELERMGASAEALSRIQSVQQGQPPSFLAAAVGTAASAYAAQQKYNVDIPEQPDYGFFSTTFDTSRFGWGNDNEFE